MSETQKRYKNPVDDINDAFNFGYFNSEEFTIIHGMALAARERILGVSVTNIDTIGQDDDGAIDHA